MAAVQNLRTVEVVGVGQRFLGPDESGLRGAVHLSKLPVAVDDAADLQDTMRRQMRKDQIVSAIRSNRGLSALRPVAEVYSRPDTAVKAHGTRAIDICSTMSAFDTATSKTHKQIIQEDRRASLAHKCFGEILCIDSYTE